MCMYVCVCVCLLNLYLPVLCDIWSQFFFLSVKLRSWFAFRLVCICMCVHACVLLCVFVRVFCMCNLCVLVTFVFASVL